MVPDWAKGKAVAEALERQYGGDKPINPNKIFVDFFTCNLENIFEAKKKKWARNSRCVCVCVVPACVQQPFISFAS